MERINVRGIVAGDLLILFGLGGVISGYGLDPIAAMIFLIPGIGLVAYNLIGPMRRKKATLQRPDSTFIRP